MPKGNEAAFDQSKGITKREYMTAMVLQAAVAANRWDLNTEIGRTALSALVVQLGDALIKELERTQT